MKKLFVVIILLVLLLPLAFAVFSGGVDSLSGDFLRQNKALNQSLVTAWGHVNGLVGDSGSQQVVKGTAGWLYFREALSDSIHVNSMTPDEIQALADSIAALSEQLAQTGTRFVLLIAPDKAAAHPEHLPYHVQPGNLADTNRARLITLLRERGVTAPDLADVLIEQDTYLATDTHWNAYGAYLAFEAMLSALEMPNPYRFIKKDFTIPAPAPGDLVPLYLPLEKDKQQDLLPDLPRSYRSQRPPRNLDDLVIETTGDPQSPGLFIARDSFGRAFFPYAANYASLLRFVRGYENFLDQARGFDIAVLLIAQRSLGGHQAALFDTGYKER